jgi:branched-chain amino acid transport system substrate-binding protein
MAHRTDRDPRAPFGRRPFLAGGLAAAALCGRSARAASAEPLRIGFLTTLTGPLASGGIQMQRGLAIYLKERGGRIAGRPVEVFTADTNGLPATARTKTAELAERNNVDVLVGPLSANEALAIDDYIRVKRLPTIAVAAAEDMTQRLANPWFVRVTSSSAQCSYPMADYARTTLGYKRMATLGEDNAYGQEQVAGFQRVFEDQGGRIVQTLFPALNAIDYATYIAQIKPDIDAIYMALAGSNGFRFFKQAGEYGFGDQVKILGGMTMVDESLLEQMGPAAVGLVSACWYSAQLDNAANTAFVAAMKREYNAVPGFYAAASNICMAVLDHALRAVEGDTTDRAKLMQALKAAIVPETVRGPVRFDSYGNVVGDVYIRRVEKRLGQSVNTVIKTYPNVGQFWTWDPKEFLTHPVYGRNEPPARFLE